MNKLNHYKQFADLFRYPDNMLLPKTKAVYESVQKQMPDYADKINDFVTAIEALTVKEQQEYFLKTFDVQAICYLDLGYVMFGEDYKRAQLLVNLQNEHKVAGVDCGNELADHLPNVLTLLAQTSSNSFAEELGFIITIPAVRFMLTKFKNIDNYYKPKL